MKIEANIRLYAMSLQIAYGGLANGNVTLDGGGEQQLMQEFETELKRLNRVMSNDRTRRNEMGGEPTRTEDDSGEGQTDHAD